MKNLWFFYVCLSRKFFSHWGPLKEIFLVPPLHSMEKIIIILRIENFELCAPTLPAFMHSRGSRFQSLSFQFSWLEEIGRLKRTVGKKSATRGSCWIGKRPSKVMVRKIQYQSNFKAWELNRQNDTRRVVFYVGCLIFKSKGLFFSNGIIII